MSLVDLLCDEEDKSRIVSQHFEPQGLKRI